MDRLFLDANVLFSAAYKPDARVRRLWELDDVVLVVSALALEEAARNLLASRPARLPDLKRLSSAAQVAPESSEPAKLPEGIRIEENDLSILSAAIQCRADYLITGDKDFEKLMGKSFGGVTVLTPAEYIRRRAAREEARKGRGA